MAWSLQNILTTVPICLLTIWYLTILWKRRKLYIYSWSVPGPISLPFIGVAYKLIGKIDDGLDVLVEMVEQHPPFMKFWFGFQLIYSIQDPVDIEKVLTSPNSLNKGYMYTLTAIYIGNGLLSAPVPKWKKHRKLIMPAFNQKIMDQFVEVFSEQAVIFTEVLEKHVGQKDIDIRHLVAAMMFDIISETTMGLKVNTQGGNSKFANDFDVMLKLMSLRVYRVWYHLDFIWKLSPIRIKLEKHVDDVHKMTSEVIRMKKELLDRKKENMNDTITAQDEEGSGKKRLAFLDLILENSVFTEKEIRDEVELFFAAGTDTTSSTICFCFEMLGMHPEVQQKAYEEVMDIVGEDRPIEASDLPSLKFVERAIKETMRLFPVGAVFQRIVDEDIKLGDKIIPEGASVIVSSLNVHRNPDIWPDPLRFDPDRFLPEETAKRHPCSFVPFSYGARNCIGNKYAIMTLKTVVATTLRKYKVFTNYKSVEDIKLNTSILIQPREGYKIYLEKR